MATKTTSQKTAGKAAASHRPVGAELAQGKVNFVGSQPLLGLQTTIGNQGILQLFESGMLKPKLRISQAGDPDEVEADRAADHVVAVSHAPKIQRKCACAGSGSSCPKCEEGAGTIHRIAASRALGPAEISIQRAPAGSAPANTPDQAGNPPKPSPTPSHTHPLVVEDDAKSVTPHQMRKSAFIAILRADACATADAVLASVGHSTKSCPYIEKWLAFYEKQSSDHIERAILKYAPETATTRSANEAIRLVVMRVRRATMTWAKTGKVTDLPADLASQLSAESSPGAVRNSASFPVGGSKPEKSVAHTPADESPAPMVSRKANGVAAGAAATPHDAHAVRTQLGAGHSLDSGVQSQMSTAFGHDFSGVRVHTDSRATALSSDLNARAFTIGSDVAFASGEYQPGTAIGDALIAHELAHVLQQKGTQLSLASIDREDSENESLEEDADTSAVGAMVSLWTGAKRNLLDVSRNAVPRLRSGLRLQRCSQTVKRCPIHYSWRVKSSFGWGPGCTCVWKCMPGDPPGGLPTSDAPQLSCPPEMNCDTGVRREELGLDYTKSGLGGHMTPISGENACGCFPLDEEGKQVSDIPLRPTDFEMTDVVAPLVDIAAAKKARAKPNVDPRTGTIIPGRPTPGVTNTEEKISPPPEHVGEILPDTKREPAPRQTTTAPEPGSGTKAAAPAAKTFEPPPEANKLAKETGLSISESIAVSEALSKGSSKTEGTRLFGEDAIARHFGVNRNAYQLPESIIERNDGMFAVVEVKNQNAPEVGSALNKFRDITALIAQKYGPHRVGSFDLYVKRDYQSFSDRAYSVDNSGTLVRDGKPVIIGGVQIRVKPRDLGP
jgi:hypothetical protein